MLFFAFEWFSRVTVDGGVYALDWFKVLFYSPFNMNTVDLLAWLPDFLWIFVIGASSSLALSASGDEQLAKGQEPTQNISTGAYKGYKGYHGYKISLSSSLSSGGQEACMCVCVCVFFSLGGWDMHM